MAFNFNWSPLIADTTRARDMLTAALNKSPKPPIIVDDIIVSELNLGSTPPELEILEIGDLAEDRFRGIFKMSYSGDAFLTLKTKVQANPLNTYLSAKPSFASPQPLAAASGLTIPLSITLSDFCLSGFVILVFSRQKGMTIVFRNDPLESLKVSSTFDSIPFVRDYLQKEIEGQLRVLFMEDLPAILHRLSLRLWSPEYQEADDNMQSRDSQAPVDPLASPPQDAVDAHGNPTDDAEADSWSLDNLHASFSAKNMIRLAALNESQRTLSLFTPSIQDAVYRAWAGAAERGERAGFTSPPLTRFSLSRIQSSVNVPTSTPSVTTSSDAGTASSAIPSLSSYGSSYNSIGGIRSRAGPAKKRKRRIVNLRRDTAPDGMPETIDEALSVSSLPPVTTPSIVPAELPELSSPPRISHRSPPKEVRFRNREDAADRYGEKSPARSPERHVDDDRTPRPTMRSSQSYVERPPLSRAPAMQSDRPLHHPAPFSTTSLPMLRTFSFDRMHANQSQHHDRSSSRTSLSPPPPFLQLSPSFAEASMSSMASTGGILEQAWMHKMGKEIARKVAEERERGGFGDSSRRTLAESFWRRESEGGASSEAPPPAYVE